MYNILVVDDEKEIRDVNEDFIIKKEEDIFHPLRMPYGCVNVQSPCSSTKAAARQALLYPR